MSNPEPTNLTQKFEALREQMTTQHDAVLSAIGDLRGEGPENNLKSLNQSIWNIAGPAPGTTLTDLHSLLSQINNGIGGWPDGFSLPGGIPLLNVQQLLSQINSSASFLSLIFDATGYSGSDTLLSTLKLLLQQFNASVVYPTMKDLMLTISKQQAQLVQLAGDPLSVVPVGMCTRPITSNGRSFLETSILAVTPVTVATWPQIIDNPDFTVSYGVYTQAYSGISCTDWLQYRIYVASNADVFGAVYGNNQRFPCNEWVTLSISGEANFSVAHDVDLTVYICGADDAVLGSCTGATDPLATTSWWQPEYGQVIPQHVTWYANAWTGGGSWSQNTQFEAVGETYYGFSIAQEVTNVAICIAWNVSNEPTIDRIGMHAFASNAQQIAYICDDIIIATDGTVGSIAVELNLEGLEPEQINSMILLPFVAFTDNHTLPPNVTMSISWIEMSAS